MPPGLERRITRKVLVEPKPGNWYLSVYEKTHALGNNLGIRGRGASRRLEEGLG